MSSSRGSSPGASVGTEPAITIFPSAWMVIDRACSTVPVPGETLTVDTPPVPKLASSTPFDVYFATANDVSPASETKPAPNTEFEAPAATARMRSAPVVDIEAFL